MFSYKLKGKHVILSLDPDFLPFLSYSGIEGSPLFAKIYDVEDEGLWLETDHFHLSPAGVPKLYNAKGKARCRAHIFVPQKAILSITTFPDAVPDLTHERRLHQIGFRARKSGKKK